MYVTASYSYFIQSRINSIEIPDQDLDQIKVEGLKLEGLELNSKLI